jgi:hypothetical protein
LPSRLTWLWHLLLQRSSLPGCAGQTPTPPPPGNDQSLRQLSPDEIPPRVTLMQDRLYRNDVTHRSIGHPHVPMTSYYLGVATRRQ